MAPPGSETLFRLLGPVEVVVDGSAITFARPQHRDLLVLLLLNANRLLTLDEVIEAMWGGAAPSTALAQVRNMASAVRAAACRAGSATLDGRGGYRLRLDERLIDLVVFEDLARRGRATGDADLLRAALGLWRGRPLAGIRAAYAEVARASIEEQRLAAVQELFDAELARGRHADIVAELTAEVRAHPLVERLVAQLMTALHGSARQAEALREYRRFRERLVTEHGLEPGPRLRELELLILRSDPAVAGRSTPPARNGPAGPAMLPRAPARLVGREAQARALCELLVDVGAGPAVVTGMAGVGKTALALHVAHAVAGHFVGGQLFVDLRGFDPHDRPLTAYDALGQLLSALGVPYDALPESLDERAGHYRSLLAGSRTLVVLDNARSSAQVRPLIPGDGASAVLVTSRSRLDGLVATAGARVLALDVLAAAAGRELLTAMAGQARADREPAAVDLLAARCGHLPLALCIAAARLRAIPSQAIATLAASIEPIELGVADDASVRAVFDASFAGLPEQNARAFALLGEHPGRAFTLAAAAALCGEDPPAVRRLLGDLAEQHLVVDCGEDRYRMHDLLAEYARRKAAELTGKGALDRAAAVRRMLDFYVAATLAADRIIHPARAVIPIELRHRGALPSFAGRADVRAALSWLDEHYPTLLTLMRIAEDAGSREHVWQLPYVMGSFFMARCHAEDSVACHQRALRAVDERDWRPFVAMSNNLAMAYHLLGRHDEALRTFRQVLARCRQEGDAEHVAMALGNLGTLYDELGEFELAIEHSEQSVQLLLQLGRDRRHVATVNLASLYRRAGRHEDARRLIGQLQGQGAARPDPRIETYALRVLGDSYGDTDETDKAVESYLGAAEVAAAAGYLVAEAAALHRLGARLLGGDPAHAIPYLRRAHALYVRTGRREAREVAALLDTTAKA